MVEFKKIIVPDEIEALCDFDQEAFSLHPQDVFPPQVWEKCESYWMIADGEVVGCSAFLLNADYNAQPRRVVYVSRAPVYGQSSKAGDSEGNRKNGKSDTRRTGASIQSLPSCGKAILESFD
jgi:hypothetical protein